ncbi:MAG TPA: LysM peptidoglycan-binding domain-containing protein [bacterium]|nr:LysM peptidoglycan-binding domain-containing protein [bacterium]
MEPRKLTLTLTLLAAGAMVYGCGNTKRIESTEVPKQPATTEKAVEAPTPVPSGKYTVVSHDTLWGIAGKSDIYSDNFQWPLIFKANRDNIKDPDLIYPRQDFVISKGATPEEMAHAKDLAMKTPKYVPHTKPRETLPLDYF